MELLKDCRTIHGLLEGSTSLFAHSTDCPLHLPEQMGKLINWIIFAKEVTHVHKREHTNSSNMESSKALQMILKVLCELKHGIYLEIPLKRSCKNDTNLSVQLWVYHNYSQQGFHERGSKEVLKEQPENSQIVTGCWRCSSPRFGIKVKPYDTFFKAGMRRWNGCPGMVWRD